MVTLIFSKELLENLRAYVFNAQKFKNIQSYKIAIALLLHGECRDIEDISKLLNVNFKTVANWIKTFMSGGIDWVMGKHFQRRGPKERLTKVQKKQLHDMIAEGPVKNGFSCGIWNRAMIGGPPA